ncbi:zinc ribbon domain-containing protein [Candidatus Bathyarchaeota archaeon]|nr:zinc ribbon domain-containing protein [Candidatus Bathyarchaeota archaeon]
MANCPKCGAKVTEEMAFCPKCGAPLKAEKPKEQPPAAPVPPTVYRGEKAEKHEKEEKGEKGEKAEKHEKREFTFIGPLIGGLVLIFLGFMAYMQVSGMLGREIAWATFLVVIGIIIIVAGIYAWMVASRRYPKT